MWSTDVFESENAESLRRLGVLLSLSELIIEPIQLVL